jgi:hypothetical protein
MGLARAERLRRLRGQFVGSLGSALGSALGVPLDHLDALALAGTPASPNLSWLRFSI